MLYGNALTDSYIKALVGLELVALRPEPLKMPWALVQFYLRTLWAPQIGECVMYNYGKSIQISLCSCSNVSVRVDSIPGQIGGVPHPGLISHVRYSPILSEKIDIRLMCISVGGLQLTSDEHHKAMCT